MSAPFAHVAGLFNEGIIFERLSGIKADQAELLQWINDWLERKGAR